MFGLGISYNKSHLFCSGVSTGIQNTLVGLSGLKSRKLPVRYLGVPLISGRLIMAVCRPIVGKITSRIRSWTSRFLSFAGRIQLHKSVLASMYNYWCNIFLLPKKLAQ